MKEITIIFEVDKPEETIAEDIINQLGNNVHVVEVESFSGTELIQLTVSVAAIATASTTVITQLIKKYYDSRKVSIKIDSIDISVYGMENALELLSVVRQGNDVNKQNSDAEME